VSVASGARDDAAEPLAGSAASAVRVERVSARAYTIPTDRPESDGTLEWDSTTLVLVRVGGGDREGIGWTYGDATIAGLIEGTLAGVVKGRDALDVGAAWTAMVSALRNNGRPGLSSMAVSALDVALWDLKARLLELPLASLLGRFHEGVPVYGSGGFTSYSDGELAKQLAGWVSEGIPRVKMKIGREPERDPHRTQVAREAIGTDTQLFVDANGAYRRKQALRLAEVFAEIGVRWFEEPVSSDDLDGLRLLRDRCPVAMDIAAGEYGYDLPYFERMLTAGAVDVLQADVTRCGGITDLARVDALCRARSIALSLHCSPTIHASAGPALETLVHMEYFHDHVRIEQMLFDGAPQPRDGVLYPPLERSGLGVEFRERDAQRYAV
jgi:L-alanine-DL-glutamate epimerase-like enolase superfamily enzyme